MRAARDGGGPILSNRLKQEEIARSGFTKQEPQALKMGSIQGSDLSFLGSRFDLVDDAASSSCSFLSG